MKQIKKLLVILFSVMFVLSLFVVNTSTVKAAEPYTYTIKVALGGSGDEGASFNKDLGITVPSGATVKLNDDKTMVIITGLKLNDQVTIDPSRLVTITPQTVQNDAGEDVQLQKYCVKGLRFSGQNDVYGAQTFNVTYDETFVVAYGVGKIVPYKVNYVMKDGSAINDPEDSTKTIQSVTNYGLEGEELYVPYKVIPGLKPNTYNYHTKSLKGPTVDADGNEKPFEFTFYYTSADSSSTVENTIETIETSSVQGDASYTYQTVSRGTTVNNPPVVNNGAAGGNDGAAAGGNEDAADAGADNNGAGDASISDDEPQDIIDIDDEDVARAGGTRDTLIRNMIIGIIIAIIAVASILVTLYIANKKRKQELVKVEKHDDNE